MSRDVSLVCTTRSLLLIAWAGIMTSTLAALSTHANVQPAYHDSSPSYATSPLMRLLAKRSYTIQEHGPMMMEQQKDPKTGEEVDCRQPGSDIMIDCETMRVGGSEKDPKFVEKVRFWNEVEAPKEVPVEAPEGVQSSAPQATEQRTVVHYWLDPTYTWNPTIQKIIEDAIESIQEVACVKFERVHGKDFPKMAHFLRFVQKGGCYSYVGIQRRPQEVSLGPGCHTVNIATHETLHALGLHHEQNRADRDRYLFVYDKNVNPRYKANFEKQPDYRLGKYDTYSVMHYRQKDFALNQNVPVLLPRQTGINPRGWHSGGCPFGSQGCHRYLSMGDVAKLRQKYGSCGGVSRTDDFQKGVGRGLGNLFGGTTSLLRFFG